MDNVFRPPQASWGLFQTLSDIEGWHGGNNNFSENYILHKAAFEAMNSMQNSKFVPWKLHERNELFEPLPDAPRHELSALQIQLSSCPAKSTFNPDTFFDGDESYELVMTNETAILRSNSTLGSLRGLQTFSQLFYAHSSTSGVYTPYVPLQIADRPRWRHRGLSIDVARNPFKPQDLIRTIKAMAATKMSRLHVHATDSQSWPLEIPSLPELARKGAYRPDLVWTAEDLRDIQLYGASKGISVFVEIDMPGHTASVAHAFPALIAAFNELDWSTFAAEPLSGQLKLNLSAVHDFLEDVLTDLLPRTRPYTSFYHIGGDEVNIPAYLLDDTVRSDDPSVLQPLLQRFIDHAIVLSTKHGLQPIVWEEMILDWNLTLPLVNGTSDGALVQVWRDSSRIEEVLKKGHRVIFGDFKHWYLDCGFGGFLDPYPTGKSPPGVPVNTTGGRPSKLTSPYLDYCAPYHNWRQMYTYDPLANISADLIAGVEGGEVLMWSEQTDSFDLDSKLWPRVASAAEVLWSGTRQDELMEDATRRLGEWRERGIIDLGINMTPVAMTWCLMNRGRCNL
ncbi:Glucosamine-6-phosphate isomerase (Glucosamine-6-phosphate deaminase) (GNPDA) (GlcN6P deaminase) [Exophiala oligosperma]